MPVALGAAHIGGTRHGGGSPAEACDEDEPPRCKDRVVRGASLSRKTLNHLEANPRPLEERGEDGAPYTLCEATLRPAPPHRSLADEPALQGASSDWKGLRLRLTL